MHGPEQQESPHLTEANTGSDLHFLCAPEGIEPLTF